ncbi:DNA gyrase subunit A [Desulfurella multipotens]|uniref:DNA gyrase subunit A n=1 Tax=Desulfurella multipotens TaxID=79269 RepID=UPI000CC88EED|nr:DNA gyrase subunit A [Desulfurella multipotens]PMP67879.1 MAG: DNA gyrase subunit A [Desulfurella multipotens]
MKDLFERVIKTNIIDTMKKSYIDYSMSVIVGRALPDARDGLKPVHRRILYAASELDLLHNKPYKKSARVVGDVIGKYHPHGDTSVYDAMVRMSQEFTMRYPLIDGQGNFGSIDGDSPAAMRYTEVRLSKIAEELLKDLDKDTVDFQPNYDESLKEPTVLPSLIPNLLVNGSSGIAVGMATNIAPHNLGEVIDALIYYIDSKRTAQTKELLNFIKGPDFPTGAIVMCDSLEEIYEKGLGKIKIRSLAKIEKIGNKHAIIIEEIPYQVNKANLVKDIAQLVKDKQIEGISDLRDESNKEGIRIVIEVKSNEQPEIILNNLYKMSNLEVSFSINNLCLVDNVPKVLSLKEYFNVFLDFREQVIKRRTIYLLNIAKERIHILEGLKIAVQNIDEVISIIKKSQTPQIAKDRLKERFNLSDKQTNAILEMRLSRLTGLEIEKLEKEYNEILEKIKNYEKILGNYDELVSIVKSELIYIKENYSDRRRTQIVTKLEEINKEDLVKQEKLLITFSNKGYIKSIPLSFYNVQSRGGKGRIAAVYSEDDYILDCLVLDSLDVVLMFSNNGRIYSIKAYEIPKSSNYTKGKAIVNLLNLKNNEQIKTINAYKPGNDYVLITQKGIIKRISSDNFSDIKSNGRTIINLLNDDQLVCVIPNVSEKDEIIICTSLGQSVRFGIEQVRKMGRNAYGVKGISLADNDYVVSGFRLQNKEEKIVLITQNGIAKVILADSIRKVSRGAKGVKIIKLKGEDRLVDAERLQDNSEILITTKLGKLIRIDSNQFREMSRYAYGVKAIELESDDSVVKVNVTKDQYCDI